KPPPSLRKAWKHHHHHGEPGKPPPPPRGAWKPPPPPPSWRKTTVKEGSQNLEGIRRPIARRRRGGVGVISVGEEDEDDEEEEEEEGRKAPALPAALEAVQAELEAVEVEAARAFRRLRSKFCLRRRPHLQRRNRLIQHIPGFWVTAFLNHPQLSAVISDRDEDALSYMTSLQVEEFGQARSGCRIRFFFNVNPYFQNDVVAKEFIRGPSGHLVSHSTPSAGGRGRTPKKSVPPPPQLFRLVREGGVLFWGGSTPFFCHLVSHSTPIRWWQGQDPQKSVPPPRSFFAWFGDHSFQRGIASPEIIKEELWPNPLQFYLLSEGTPKGQKLGGGGGNPKFFF
ncbi:testis-specific Y-encoded-like protein 4, partial [Podargus strigoides]